MHDTENAMNDTPRDASLEARLVEFLKVTLKLGDDVEIDPRASLIDQIGLDSIEAFDAVATIHEIMGVTIPDDFSPKLISTLRELGDFIATRYEAAVVARFMACDFQALESSL
jgi:acyl carrier protein